jgi:large subunit ribosomal protein L29
MRELSSEELGRRLVDTRQELFNLRFQSATGQLENVARLRHVRRDIARILTVLQEKEDG